MAVLQLLFLPFPLPQIVQLRHLKGSFMCSINNLADVMFPLKHLSPVLLTGHSPSLNLNIAFSGTLSLIFSRQNHFLLHHLCNVINFLLEPFMEKEVSIFGLHNA